MGVVMRSAIVETGNATVRACGIAVMAKASVPGHTKTRLVPPLTFEQAAQCNTAFLRDAAENILAAAAQSSIAGYVAYGPADARTFFHDNLPQDIALIEACYPSLGDCLDHAIAQLLARGHRAAVVINSDSPTLPTPLLIETAELLARPGDRAVLGPALDGGYYLLGVKAQHCRLLEDIAWSTPQVTPQTLERAAELHLPVHILPTWYDVDDIAGLKMMLAELFEGQSFAAELSPAQPRHTRALFKSLAETAELGDRLTLNGFRGAAE
jgi:rSAM/selenodomain-associated transferase 1